MTILPIRLVPDPVLRQTAKPVEKITPSVLQLLDDMLATMYDAEGIGLAAPQIGVLQRLIVMDVSPRDADQPAPYKMINPEIVAFSEEVSSYDEGCLSIPQMNGEVVRPSRVTLRYTDVNGLPQEIMASGILATCIQHEIDHLNGKLFIDHLSPLKRNMLMRRYNKRQREESM